MPVSPAPPLALPEPLPEFLPALPRQARLWLVGGAVRDALLNRRVRDFDFVVDGDALALGRALAQRLGADCYPLDAGRDVARVIVSREAGRCTLDFARLRGPDLEADLRERDFTVNAMAAALSDPEKLLDPLGGWSDLRNRIVRQCAPHALASDPLRALRAVRLAAQLDFRIEPETRAAVRAQSAALQAVSAERRRDEFIRCLGGPRPAAALRALERLGLLEALAPEMLATRGLNQPPPHMLDVWEHTLAVLTRLQQILAVLAPVYDLEAASDLTLGLVSLKLGRHRQRLAEYLEASLSGDRPRRWLLMLGALLHDCGKPLTRSQEADGRVRFLGHEGRGAELARDRLAELRFSTDETRFVQGLAAQHMRPRQLSKAPGGTGAVSRRAIYRFFRDVGETGPAIILLSLADYLGKYTGSPPSQDEWGRHVEVCAELLTACYEQPETVIAPPPLVSGTDLMLEFNLAPGPRLGELLEAVREAQAAGEVQDRPQALDLVRRRLAGEG